MIFLPIGHIFRFWQLPPPCVSLGGSSAPSGFFARTSRGTAHDASRYALGMEHDETSTLMPRCGAVRSHDSRRDPGNPLFAQVQRNVGFESRTFAIVKARLVISPDEELESGTLVIRDGLIVAVGREVPIPPDAEQIDGTGLILYPGFIDAASSALIDPNRVPAPAAGRPIDFARFALAATPPDNRKSLTPDLLAHEALKSDAALLENRRKVGFTSVHVVLRGGSPAARRHS